LQISVKYGGASKGEGDAGWELRRKPLEAMKRGEGVVPTNWLKKKTETGKEKTFRANADGVSAARNNWRSCKSRKQVQSRWAGGEPSVKNGGGSVRGKKGKSYVRDLTPQQEKGGP